MAINLTELARSKAAGILQNVQLVLEIEGIDQKFGIGKIKRYARIGDENLYINTINDEWIDWFIGGLFQIENQKDIISFDGTTDNVSQQLNIDNGGSTSIQSFQIALLDADGYATELITPNKIVEDLLGRKAKVWLGYKDTSFPVDFTQIMQGQIDEIQAGALVILNIAHPEQRKRGECFIKAASELVEDAEFRSKTFQGVLYKVRKDVVGNVNINLTAGGTAGSEVVTESLQTITIQIQSGVSTAQNVRNAIEKSIAALSLISVEIAQDINGNSLSTTIQNPASFLLGTDTTLVLKSTSGFKLPNVASGLISAVKINDEVISYTGISGNTLTGCQRELLKLRDARSYGQHHKIGDAVESFYILEGDAINLALRMMLSGGDLYFATGIRPKNLGFIDSGENLNAIWFENENVVDLYGLVAGDMVSITGDTFPANNMTDIVIIATVVTQFGSYLIFDEEFTLSLNSPATLSFRSKYNVWSDGLGMGGDQVDVPQFEQIKLTFSSSILNYYWYLKDTVNGKDFIDTKLLFPTGAFSIPRKGKVSAGYSSPPLATEDLLTLDESNTVDAKNNKVMRSTNKNFYNNIVFKFDESVIDEKFLGGDISSSEESKNRIKTTNKTLTIEVGGLRRSDTTLDQLRILRERILDQYKFGAESLEVKTFYGPTFNRDIGDIVVFGSENYNLPDTKSASRKFSPRLMQIRNKKLSAKRGENTLLLVDTGLSLGQARFGVVSPSSVIDADSAVDFIYVKDSFAYPQYKERFKWEPYIGQRVLIRTEDWSQAEETVFIGIDDGDDYKFLIEPLSFTPTEGMILDVVPYPANNNPEDQQLYKRIFCFTNPSVQVVSAVSQSELVVAPSDISKFFVGCILRVNNEDFSDYSAEFTVESIAGNNITISGPLGFLPDNTYTIELIGFSDEGSPYRFI